MRYVTLGKSGLEVSRVALGCMSYGDPARGRHSWTLDEEASSRFITRALDLGVNFFDTANEYSDGSSEEIIGRVLAKHARREDIVIATKVFAPMRQGPNSLGLSRKAIMTEVDASLRRLGTDYIDLYQIHRFDPRTPLEETLQALDDVVRAGKVRYLGASSMYAWQFAKALYTADLHGWTRFISMQNHYNLINREEEREMLPLCADQGIGVIPWSPLARGKLTRDPGADTERSRDDQFSQMLYAATADADRTVIERVAGLAERRGLPRAQIALAWVASRPGVTAPIVGATKDHHLDDAVAALDVELTEEEVAHLEEPYVPHGVVGFA
ncbi:alcohol dehydrogenase [Streptomyces sp. MNU77]|uniref:aldo/keto reductase n=1 Tax=Streptomyces sp. MNU77 TaxID=1573406 RepID=UPI0005E9FDAB|nr:aldo/keto reductase [Streptomyces sp. MNU77]OLO25843.1 alcohol dehydrogenase [Streptomyces sp. MNU77]